MKNSVLVDTNLLVYFADRDSEFHVATTQFLLASPYLLFTTSKNIAEFLMAVTKGEKPKLSTDSALRYVEDFRGSFEIIYPDERSTRLFINLVEQYQVKGLRVHDAEIAAIGLAQGISTIATFNISDFKGFEEVSLLTP